MPGLVSTAERATVVRRRREWVEDAEEDQVGVSEGQLVVDLVGVKLVVKQTEVEVDQVEESEDQLEVSKGQVVVDLVDVKLVVKQTEVDEVEVDQVENRLGVDQVEDPLEVEMEADLEGDLVAD
nr:hypothetical protein BaRGS_020047 [Batillaria attramentaria]